VMLEQAGVVAPGHRLAMIHTWNTATLLVKKGPFDPAEVARIRAFCEERSFDVAWYAGMAESEANRFNRSAEPDLHRAAVALLGPEREQFLEAYRFHVAPATDDRPYFFRFFKWESLPELFALRAQGGLTQVDIGYLVHLGTLAQAAGASLFLILLPLAIRRVGTSGAFLARWRVAVYFLALGFGFIFIEISFIQRFTLFLGHPLTAIAVVLAAFLVFAGIGSGASAALGTQSRAALLVAAGAIVVLAGTYLIALPVALSRLMALPLLAKAALTTTLIAPLAFTMGLPFPLGLSRVSAEAPGLVPWAWAINGCSSVVGAVLAGILAMHFGFTAVVCMALVLYALAAVVFSLEPGSKAF
jgi:hypothetical protein